MNSRSFWVKGNRDDYAHFLARTHNAELLAVSSPFCFEIKSREFSSLALRRVSVSGHCSLKLISQDQHQLQPLITLRVKLNQASIASNF